MIRGLSRQFFRLTQIFILSVIGDNRCKDTLHNEMLADYDFFLVALE